MTNHPPPALVSTTCHTLVLEAVRLYMRVDFFCWFAVGLRKRRMRAIKRRLYQRVDRPINLFLLGETHG